MIKVLSSQVRSKVILITHSQISPGVVTFLFKSPVRGRDTE